MLTALNEPNEIRPAQDRFLERLKDGAQVFASKLGWHGGGMNEPVEVYWHQKQGFWAYASDQFTENRYWVAFGTQNPSQVSASLTLTCEINVPFEGVDRRVAGAFVTDSERENAPVYIAHSGKIGGGRKGVGKMAFLNHLRGQDQRLPVKWADGKETEMVVIAGLEDSGFISQIGHFVQEVERIKELLVSGVGAPPPAKQKSARSIGFTPEFKGTKQYSQKRTVVSNCDHGVVVDFLYRELKSLGFEPHNDQRDLFLVHGGKVTAVFEAKTAVKTTDIYTAIGQLYFYTALEPGIPHRILVLPEEPTDGTLERIRNLGIRVLCYSMSEGDVKFHGLDKLAPVLSKLPEP